MRDGSTNLERLEGVLSEDPELERADSDKRLGINEEMIFCSRNEKCRGSFAGSQLRRHSNNAASGTSVSGFSVLSSVTSSMPSGVQRQAFREAGSNIQTYGTPKWR